MIEMTHDEIDELMSNARIGRIAMAGSDGQPYIVPMPFCWHNGTVYLRLPLTGRKGQVLQENDRICFEADCCTDDMADYASVLVEGRLCVVSDLEEKAAVKAANDDKYDRLRGGFRPGHGRGTGLASLPMKKIEISRLSGRKKEVALCSSQN